MINKVIKGDYVNAQVVYGYEKIGDKKKKVYIVYGKAYKAYINKETVAYCNLVEKEVYVKKIASLIKYFYWSNVADGVGKVYAHTNPVIKIIYYIEIELKDGKCFYIKADEKVLEGIRKQIIMQVYATGEYITKNDFDNYKLSEEEIKIHEEEEAIRIKNSKINLKIFAVFGILSFMIILVGIIYCMRLKTDTTATADSGIIISKEEDKNEKLEEESKVWGYYKDTKEAMNILTDELVNSEDSELENVRLIAEEIENKADDIWEYINGLERKEYNEKYYGACQEYIVMCRIAAENIKEYTQDNDKEHLETAIECIKAGEESVESVEEYRRDCLRGIGCSDEEIERLVGEKE